MTRPLHVGVVGCSAEGAALCYRTIFAEAPALLGAHAHPEVSLHTPSLTLYLRCLEHGDLDGVAALMPDSARRLAAIGAELLIRACSHDGGDRVSTPNGLNPGAKPQAWQAPRQGFATPSEPAWRAHPSGRGVLGRIAALPALRGA